jgi:hypothetical protein
VLSPAPRSQGTPPMLPLSLRHGCFALNAPSSRCARAAGTLRHSTQTWVPREAKPGLPQEPPSGRRSMHNQCSVLRSTKARLPKPRGANACNIGPSLHAPPKCPAAAQASRACPCAPYMCLAPRVQASARSCLLSVKKRAPCPRAATVCRAVERRTPGGTSPQALHPRLRGFFPPAAAACPEPGCCAECAACPLPCPAGWVGHGAEA